MLRAGLRTVALMACGMLLCTPVLSAGRQSHPGGDGATATAEHTVADIFLRLGQGGFRDGRSPEGALGGGQNTIDIHLSPDQQPFALSLSAEFYTNSADAKSPYEIAGLRSASILYTRYPDRYDSLRLFVGAGVGRLEIHDESRWPDFQADASLLQVEAGIDKRLWKSLGLYASAKYLKSDRVIDGEKLIDFSETILLIGITLHFRRGD